MPEPAHRPPSVDALARSLEATGLPHPLRVDAARRAIAAGQPQSVAAEAERIGRAQLQPVVNATGVLLHTNLGRAPFAIHQDASATNVEYDLELGRRGSRQAHAGPLLARACGAEAALVVNNGAAAVCLVLAALAGGARVAVSRGELVEIGGGFRIPDVLAQSGAELIEVGTTNRTRASDYEQVAGDVALFLKVHKSNYRIEGFTGAVDVATLARLGPPVIADTGSGLLDAACPWLADGPPGWLAGEPAARQTLAAGAALITFSGDKLLGGPQAGIIAGRRELVERCAQHPLYRALRPGAHILGAVSDVAMAYLARTAGELPFWRMATASVASLHARADVLVDALGRRSSIVVVSGNCESTPGGGTLPGVKISSWGVHLEGDHAALLRRAEPPVLATVRDGATHLDLRTVEPERDGELAGAIEQLAPR